MKIGIDISQIVYKGTGVARFTEGLINAILEYDKINSWTFLFYSLRQNLDPELEKKILSKGHTLIKWPLPPTLVSFISNKFRNLPSSIYRLPSNLDCFITSDWIELPLKKVNKVTIVHDLVFKRYPKTVNKKILITQEHRLNHVKKESKIIFTDSQTTKKDLISFFKINPEKIVVNYPGVKVVIPQEEQIKKTLSKYYINKPFVLSVGKLEPRKNINNLINAYVKINNKNIDLVIVGPPGWNNQIIQHPTSSIKYLGLISDQELYSLYSASQAFIFPSLWEGFGYPLVEAMILKTPIICSKISPFEEIANSSAYYFNPLNVNEITQSLNKVLSDNQLKIKLTQSGKIRAEEFSWEKYYNTMIKTLNSNLQVENKS